MDEQQRTILNEVAEGRLSPEEAADLLREAEEAERGRQEPPPSGVRRVRVVGTLQAARIVGDPTVREAVAEGPHVARREGETIVIEGRHVSAAGPGPGFVFGPEAPSGTARGGPGVRGAQLTVRMHPDLELDVQLEAGTLTVEGVSGPLRAHVEAGSARIERFRAPLDLAMGAGTVQASGVLDHGASRIRCQAGSVRVHLERGSSVRISARTHLGRVALPDGGGHWAAGDAMREVTVGAGAGTLEVVGELGNVTVSAEG